MTTSLPMTCAHAMRVASGTTGLTLPGMMLEPGCRSGRWISPRPVRGPELIQRRSLQIFVRLTATTLSAPDSSTTASCADCASKWFAASRNGRPVTPDDPLDDLAREARCRVEPRARGGPTEGQLARRLGGGAHPAGAELDLPPVAAELLTEGHGHGVHEVRAARLDDVGELRLLAAQREREVLERRHEVEHGGRRRGDAQRARERVVARLAGVDVVVGMHVEAAGEVRDPRDDLVDVHVRRGAGPGLEDVDGELVVVLAVRDLTGRRRDGTGAVARRAPRARR